MCRGRASWWRRRGRQERSFCCGAGGGLAFLGEETGERVSHVRAAELVATGAETIGTACPFCNTMFRDATGGVASGTAAAAGYRAADGAGFAGLSRGSAVSL